VKKEKYEFYNFRPIALILATKANILKKTENKDTDHVFDWIKQSYDNDMKKSKGEDEAVSCLITGLKMFQKQLGKSTQTKIEYNPLLYIVSYCNRVDMAKYMFNEDLCYVKTHFNAEEANSRRKLLLKSYLKFSCENGLLDLSRFLFQEINNKQESFQPLRFDGSFLKTACSFKHIEIFKYLLEDENAKNEATEFLKGFPLHYASQYGSLEIVQYFIKTKQIDLELRDKEGRTPLHLACRAGSIEIAKYLIAQQNANINASNNLGRSVWHFVIESKCLELVKYISQKTKQDVNAQDEDGSTTLHLACEKYESSLKIVKFLITDMKANLHSIDKEGRTALHVHCQSRWINVSDFSISYGPEVPILKFLVNKGANVLAKDNSGKSPLQIAKSELEDPDFRSERKKMLITFLQAATKR
jgi:hypothetical protein